MNGDVILLATRSEGKLRELRPLFEAADWQEAADYTASIAREGDYVLTLGCGNVYQIIPQVLDSLRRTSED